ncbi:efflux RND transporter periplasmic adaptor subunit [Phaeobacter sp. A36a-5a]|uniref:efflux RND transporter periplasmic adaptor subunit n=1 Tax=Phaeobacter bryozoorum TaxID=1086632 RepID=UPI0030C9B15F
MASPLHSKPQGRAGAARRETAPPTGPAAAVPPLSAVTGAAQAAPVELVFVSDARATWPPLLAAAIYLGLVVWMLVGLFWPAAPLPPPDGGNSSVTEPVSVAVQLSQAAPVTRLLHAEGHSRADRDATLRAEMSGHVATVAVAKGARVAQGQILATLQAGPQQAALARAEASQLRAEHEYTRAAALHQRGSTTDQRLSEAREALAVAKADLAAARQSLAETQLTAPFAGHLEAFDLTPGAYVQEGAEVARVVALDPLRVVFQVPQHQRGSLTEGAIAQVRFLDGRSGEGRLSFLGQSAAAETRSFTAELTLANPAERSAAIPAGVSARIEVPLDQVQAHFLSPALLSLDMAGGLGVKSVDDTDRVVFTPVEIVQSARDGAGVWVSGLPDQLRLITVGQGFVSAGERVRPGGDGNGAADPS